MLIVASFPETNFQPLTGVFMKLNLIALSAAAAVSLLASPAFASKELATKNACMACHDVAAKKMGPAFQEVAKKYAGKKDAVATVTANIKAGGAGKWGNIPMPAQAGLSDADTKALATWIVGGAK
jgi:cytochrome c